MTVGLPPYVPAHPMQPGQQMTLPMYFANGYTGLPLGTHAVMSEFTKPGKTRDRTSSGGLRLDSNVSPGLLPLYIGCMLLLPIAVFIFSCYTTRNSALSELARNTSAPVTYAVYYMEPGDVSRDMEADHVWIRVPQISDSHANGVFASNQFSFQRGHGGYMGTQVRRKGAVGTNFGWMLDSGVAHRVIFSIWDGSPTHKAIPGTDPVSVANCGRFGGEGTGAHCHIEYPLQLGAKVTVRMEHAGRGEGGDLWRGFVRDPVTGASTELGSIFVPDMDGDGFGLLEPWRSCGAFQEYWKASGCDNQAESIVGIFGPFFHSRTLVPDKAQPQYKHGCQHESLSACIPGYGCGKPRVLMKAGGNTVHEVPEGVDVWAAPEVPAA